MHQSEGKKNNIFLFLFLFILFSSINNKFFFEKKNSLLKIDNIRVIGLEKNENYKIFQQLKKNLMKNIFFIKQDRFKEILKNNNLIQSFTVKKNYPNTIIVNIKKTIFLAITNVKNKKYFIGSNAKLIRYEKLENQYNQLPYVFGKLNYVDFVYFKKIIDRSEFDFLKISNFYYFPSKRWDIKTKNGLVIKLPEKNSLNALNFAYKMIISDKFNDIKLIDLRNTNLIITKNE